jgi:hypothetical protein
VCTLVQRAGARYIEGTFNESILDPVIRQKLVESSGFCFEHTWLSINLKLSDALGHAIIFQDLLKKATNILLDHGMDPGMEPTDALITAKRCPACQIEDETLDRVIKSLANAMRDQDFLSDFKQSDGLCIPHLARLLGSVDEKRQSAAITHQLACMETLRKELGEFIRKSDYRYRDEMMGKEGDSYKRAADMLKGKHRPIEKKDLK